MRHRTKIVAAVIQSVSVLVISLSGIGEDELVHPDDSPIDSGSGVP